MLIFIIEMKMIKNTIDFKNNKTIVFKRIEQIKIEIKAIENRPNINTKKKKAI